MIAIRQGNHYLIEPLSRIKYTCFFLQQVEAMGSIAPHEEDDSSVKPAEDGNNM